ncbi:MAG: beta-lactamase family protein [Gammaproteobacteria bacterium]|nr:beta-lactamase family protein [Gammaproteobacteria bacterium]
MKTLSLDTPQGRIEGLYDSAFTAVADAFVANFTERDEVGASVALTLEGRKVVDLWGGRRARNGAPWERDTVATVFSATKGAMAVCAHMLADRGALDLDEKISHYWPEFAVNGKEDARVGMTLDHSVGVPHVRDAVPAGGFYDYDAMVKRVAAEPAFWAPGTRVGYHAITMAWTVGELIHRAARKRLGQFFQDEVAKPLGLEFWIGMPRELHGRISPMIPATPDQPWLDSRFVKAALGAAGTPTQLFMRDFLLVDANSADCHAAEIGSANGLANARALAGLYAPLANGGSITNTRLVGPDTLTRMARTSMASHDDATLLARMNFSEGFMKAIDNRRTPDVVNSSLLIADGAFGHVGAGGSLGFADPACRMSFGYAMNRMGTGLLLNPRGQSLVDAAYGALGYRSNASGAWSH